MADEVEETNLEWTDLEETDQGSGTSQPPFDNRVMAADSPEKPILHNETIVEQFGYLFRGDSIRAVNSAMNLIVNMTERWGIHWDYSPL